MLKGILLASIMLTSTDWSLCTSATAKEKGDAAISGTWLKTGSSSDCNCGKCISISLDERNDYFCVESNQIYVSTYYRLDRSRKSLSLFFIKPTDVGTGGAALPWEDFDSKKPIATIDVSKAKRGTVRVKWIGFRSKKDPTKIYRFGDAYTGEYERRRTNLGQ